MMNDLGMNQWDRKKLGYKLGLKNKNVVWVDVPQIRYKWFLLVHYGRVAHEWHQFSQKNIVTVVTKN